MDASSPDATQDGIIVELSITGSTGVYTGTIKDYSGGVLQSTTNFTGGTDGAAVSGWFEVKVDGDDVTAYWRGTSEATKTVTTSTNTRYGFGINATEAGYVCLVGAVRLQYTSDSGIDQNRDWLVAVCNGVFNYYDGLDWNTTTGGTIQSTHLTEQVHGAQLGQKYYFTNPQRVDATDYKPLVWDPASPTSVAELTESTGNSMPTGCRLLCRYRDRLVLAGDPNAPQVWYMSRQGTYDDFNYGADAEDVQRAVAGNQGDAGVPGEPITALISNSDDYLVMAAENSMWILRGDPAYGGAIDKLHPSIGVVSGYAWCYSPDGWLYFLSRDGVYRMPPGAEGRPESISRVRLPRELRKVDGEQYNVMLAYDLVGQGIHIYLTGKVAAEGTHWWFDLMTGSFWPVDLPDNYAPTAIYSYAGMAYNEPVVFLGGQDGYIRAYSNLQQSDGTTAITSFVDIGPFLVGNSLYEDGCINELVAILGENSESVTWTLRVDDGPEQAFNQTTNIATGTWSGGRNYTDRPRARGGAAVLRLAGATGFRHWSMESVVAATQVRGRQKVIG